MSPTSANRRAAVVAAVAVALVLAGCGSDAVEPGPEAGSAACTALLARLPAQVLSRNRVTLDVTGAAAWGDPAIVLRCGVPRTGPTTDPCNEVNGIDWTFSQNKKTFRALTFGRVPEIEVTVPLSVGPSNAPSSLIDLADAVKPIPRTDDVCS